MSKGLSERALGPFFRGLSAMFNCGIPLHQAFQALAAGETDPHLRCWGEQVASRLAQGHSLAQAFKLSQLPMTWILSLISVGERSGRLAYCLDRIADKLEKDHASRMQQQQLLVYPAFTLGVATLMLCMVPALVFPAQQKLMGELGVNLHGPLAGLFNIWSKLASPWFFCGLGLASFFAVRQPKIRRALSLAGSRIPGPWQTVRTQLELSALWAELSIQIDSGLPVLQSIQTIQQQKGWSSALALVAEQVMQGEELNRAFSLAGFPRTAVEMLKVGEESGQLPKVFSWLKDFYAEGARHQMESLLAWIEPIVLLGLGMLCAVLILVTLLPMVSTLNVLG